METINTIELTDESIFPDEGVLKKVLGRSFNAYLELLKLFTDNELTYEWRYYKDGKAWLCKVQKKKRTIVWMSAWKGYMQATVYFPLRFLDDILTLKITEDSKSKILKTKNVGKSKPCIFEIRNKKAIKDLEKVMNFKIVTKQTNQFSDKKNTGAHLTFGECRFYGFRIIHLLSIIGETSGDFDVELKKTKGRI